MKDTGPSKRVGRDAVRHSGQRKPSGPMVRRVPWPGGRQGDGLAVVKHRSRTRRADTSGRGRGFFVEG